MKAGTSFATADAAWIWTMATLEARQARTAGRACGADALAEAVVKCLDELYRHRRIELLHVRILRHWGMRGRAPNPSVARERCDWGLWREALDRVEYKLRQRGIVAGVPVPPVCP